MNKLFNINNDKKFQPPIWLMRQAGRYLPEYRNIRKSVNSFLDLCYNPKLASEVTLQPINRFDFDAAIIFSDILVIPDALGIKVSFEKDIGPKLEKFDKISLDSLKLGSLKNNLEKTYEAIKITRDSLEKSKDLIGFAGGFWTIFAYIAEGGSSKDFSYAKNIAFCEGEKFLKIKTILIDAISRHLINQIKSGCNVVKIFDSWAGILTPLQFSNLVIDPTIEIIRKVRKEIPDAKIIGFPRGAGFGYYDYGKKVDVDAMALDYNFPVENFKDLYSQTGKILQGNLDPAFLLGNNKDKIKEEIIKILNNMEGLPFIFNLGHGILPKTPIENVNLLVETIRSYKN